MRCYMLPIVVIPGQILTRSRPRGARSAVPIWASEWFADICRFAYLRELSRMFICNAGEWFIWAG